LPPRHSAHHLEYVSRLLADQLGATPQFRSDGNYELGELLPPVLARMSDLYGKAAAAAQSWKNQTEKDAVAKRKTTLSSAAAHRTSSNGRLRRPFTTTNGPILEKRISNLL